MYEILCEQFALVSPQNMTFTEAKVALESSESLRGYIVSLASGKLDEFLDSL